MNGENYSRGTYLSPILAGKSDVIMELTGFPADGGRHGGSSRDYQVSPLPSPIPILPSGPASDLLLPSPLGETVMTGETATVATEATAAIGEATDPGDDLARHQNIADRGALAAMPAGPS